MTTTVPAWQNKIRAAQSIEQVRIAEQQAKRDEKKRELDLEQAGFLKRALACLGIDAAPTSNEWEVDGYTFRLQRHEYSESVHFHEKANGELHFKLWIVRPAIHELYGQLDYADPYRKLTEEVSTEFSIPETGPEQNWTVVRSAVAFALDKLDQREKELAEQLADEQRRAAASNTRTDRFPTAAEELARLIGQLVGEEVRNQLGHNDD